MQKAGNNTIYNIPSTFLSDQDMQKLRWLSTYFAIALNSTTQIIESINVASKYAMETKSIEYTVFNSNLG